MSSPENPYASPTASDSPTLTGVGEFAPCYKCGSTAARKVGYTWWGGWLGPKMLNHVRCVECDAAYDGKTGASNRRAIAIYLMVGVVIGFIVGFVVPQLLR